MKILALSPHTDDVELGCGGSIVKWIEKGDKVRVVCFSDADQPNIIEEWQNSLDILGVKNKQLHLFPRRIFNEKRQEILDLLIREQDLYNPDLVLIPSVHDIHQDHQVIAQEGLRAFNDCSIIGYELPWDCKDFKPNMWIELQSYHYLTKTEALRQYKSQEKRGYFGGTFISNWGRFRGGQINRFLAEAFEVYKWIQ